MIITTSWDDGHSLDLRLAEMLSCYGLKGTFYVARHFLDERMSESQLRELAQDHEIGAHTVNHPTLTDIPIEEARREMIDSKHWLEDVLGQSVTSFCYPRGAQNSALQTVAQEVGFAMARGASGYHLTPQSRYNMETTLHIYPFPMRPLPDIPFWRGIGTRLQPLRNALPHCKRLNIPLTALSDWNALAKHLLNTASAEGQIWHLWGHSWEIDKFDMWSNLDEALQAAASMTATAMTNTQVAQQLWDETA